MKWLAIVSVLLVAACTHPGPQPVADAAWTQSVKVGGAPTDKARIYAFDGKILRDLSFDTRNPFPSDVVVNGVMVGKIAHGECIAFDVAPGIYQFPYTEPPFTRTVHAGEAIYLSYDIRQGVGAAFGLLGAMTNPYTKVLTEHSDGPALVQEMTVVLPNPDAISRLRPMGSP